MLEFAIKIHENYHYVDLHLKDNEKNSSTAFARVTKNYEINNKLTLIQVDRKLTGYLSTDLCHDIFDLALERSTSVTNVQQKINRINDTYIKILNDYHSISTESFNEYKNKKHKIPLTKLSEKNNKSFLGSDPNTIQVIDKSAGTVEFLVDNHIEIYGNMIPQYILLYDKKANCLFQALKIRLQIFHDVIEIILSDYSNYRYMCCKNSTLTCYSSESELYSVIDMTVMLATYKKYLRTIDTNLELDEFMNNLDSYQELERMWSI